MTLGLLGKTGSDNGSQVGMLLEYVISVQSSSGTANAPFPLDPEVAPTCAVYLLDVSVSSPLSLSQPRSSPVGVLPPLEPQRNQADMLYPPFETCGQVETALIRTLSAAAEQSAREGVFPPSVVKMANASEKCLRPPRAALGIRRSLRSSREGSGRWDAHVLRCGGCVGVVTYIQGGHFCGPSSRVR